MKNRFSFALVALLLVSLSLSSLSFAQQSGQSPVGGITSGKTTPATPTTSRRTTRPRSTGGNAATIAIERDLTEALGVIEENYVDGSKLDYNNAFKSSIIGMLRTLDPHSNYYDREEFDELKTDQRSEYYGIGASIVNATIGDNTDTYIQATFENWPAARAGLLYGDRIVAVNGDDMRAKSSLEVRDKIRGPKGSTVKVTVERAATGKVETVEITRDAVPQPSVPDAYFLKPGVGYIDMTRGFNYTTTDELTEALEELHSKGMTSLVLDLRNNPGGFLDQAIRVAEKFLPSGKVILTQKGRDSYNDKRAESNNPSPDMTPLVILVNGGTASASEIVAGAMQDHDRALIVGQTSFGKGLVQSIIQLDYGAGLTLTSAKYYTPSGRLIQRDYSNGGFYDYYTRGGSTRLEQKNQQAKPNGPALKTDTGRTVYGGGGITPDEDVKARSVSVLQSKLQLGPVFFFARDLISGRVAGFDAYKIQRPIDFHHELQASDFPVTDALFKAFKDYVAKQPSWKFTDAQLDRNRDFIELELRRNLVTAAYGTVMATRIFVSRNSSDIDDPQVARAIAVLPRAKDLAVSALRAKN